MNFFHTTEFYVILFIAAAFVVAYMAMPQGQGPVRELLLGSELRAEGLEEASVSVDCRDDGTVVVTRHGLREIGMSGAVSAKVTVKSDSITIEERLVEGGAVDDTAAIEARFALDFLASKRYYLRYESEATSSHATLAFRNTPGYHAGPVALSH